MKQVLVVKTQTHLMTDDFYVTKLEKERASKPIPTCTKESHGLTLAEGKSVWV